MANNIFQAKRTTVSGRVPNTTGSYATNSQYIAAGEFALNMADGILYTSNGSAVITVGSNLVNQNITGNLSLTVNNKRLTFTPNAGGSNVYFIQQNDDNFVFYSTNTLNQPRSVFSIFANSTTSNLNVSVPANFNNNVGFGTTAALYANGGPGTAGQVLSSNGTTIYWATAGAASVNVAATYDWTNSHTWSTAANLAIGGTIQSDTKFYLNTTWATDASTYNFYATAQDNNTALTAIRNKYGIYSSLNNRSQNKNVDGVTFYNSNYRAVIGDAINASTTAGGNAFASELIGGNFKSFNYANGSGANGVNVAVGTRNQVFSYGTGVITTAYGSQAQIFIGNSTATGNITTAYGVSSSIESNTAATISTGYLFYGTYTGSTTTTKYGIYLTGEANNYISNNVVIGGSVNAASYSVGTIFIANTTQLTLTVPFSANGGVGTAGQVLTSNGASGAPYWSTVSGGSGSVNVAAQYSWTNVHTFSNVVYLGTTSGSNVGVGTTSPAYKLQVNGSFAATTKSFVIDHPTKQDMKLRYGSLEGPENGVYVRGRLDNQSIIDLPDYWWNLIDPHSITVNITPYGKSQDIWVQSTSAYKINLNQPADCYFTVFAERKDVDKLVVEF